MAAYEDFQFFRVKPATIASDLVGADGADPAAGPDGNAAPERDALRHALEQLHREVRRLHAHRRRRGRIARIFGRVARLVTIGEKAREKPRMRASA